jgi:hypothetical protein
VTRKRYNHAFMTVLTRQVREALHAAGLPDLRREEERKAKQASKMKQGSKIQMPSDAAKRLYSSNSTAANDVETHE